VFEENRRGVIALGALESPDLEALRARLNPRQIHANLGALRAARVLDFG
jgi:hypothetical protein